MEREIERGERKLRRADGEKYISGKQAGTLLKREIRKVMDKVKARREREGVCACTSAGTHTLVMYFEALTYSVCLPPTSPPI